MGGDGSLQKVLENIGDNMADELHNTEEGLKDGEGNNYSWDDLDNKLVEIYVSGDLTKDLKYNVTPMEELRHVRVRAEQQATKLGLDYFLLQMSIGKIPVFTGTKTCHPERWSITVNYYKRITDTNKPS